MTIVHIGLGKTATTTLQKHIFPKAAEAAGYRFNDPELTALLIKSNALSLSSEEKAEIRRRLAAAKHFISLESLVNWTPAFWAWSADKNLELLGPETDILISVREPLSWMISVYQQAVQEGNAIAPQDFFITKQELAALDLLLAPGRLQYFCSDLCDYAELDRLYRDRFRQVRVVDISQIGRMEFLDGLIELAPEAKAEFAAAFAATPRENLAYSAGAMRLTLARERLLRRLGVKSVGSADRRYGDYLEMVRHWSEAPAVIDRPGFARRLARRLAEGRLPSWRAFMQAGFDRVVPYRKFQLPSDVYINWDLVQRNRQFIAERVLD